MRRDDSDLRDVQLQRSQRPKILSNRFRRLAGKSDDVVTMRVALRCVQSPRQFHHRFHFFAFMNLLEHILVKTLDAKKRAFHALGQPFVEIPQK